MQMPESSLNISTLIRHLLKVICDFDIRYILRFISQITYITHYSNMIQVDSTPSDGIYGSIGALTK